MSFAVINGNKLFYEIKGEAGNKEMIAFFNGGLASTSSWHGLASLFLGYGFSSILHDFRGQGQSDSPEEDYTFETLAEEANGVFEQAGVKKVHCVGLSTGGTTAIRFACLFPDKVKSLTLMNTYATPHANFKLNHQAAAKTLLNPGFENKLNYMADLISYALSDDFIASHKETVEGFIQALANKEDVFFRMQGYLRRAHGDDIFDVSEMQKIKVPTMIIASDKDMIHPKNYSDIIYKNIPHAEYVILQDCGHISVMEKPGLITTLLLGFLLRQKG